MNARTLPATLDRSTYLGSSDIAAIMGLSPWATPLEVYLRKIGEAPDAFSPEREKLFRRGKRLEPVVMDMMAEEFEGLKIVKRSTPEEPNRYTDAEHAFMRAEIDFEFEVTRELVAMFPQLQPFAGTVQNGEVKTVHPFASKKWGEAETDEMPIEYAAQTMFGLSLTSRDVCLVGALFGADNLVPYIITRDDETVAGMRAKAAAFWFENVQKRVPPDPINMEDMMRLFARVNGRAVQLDDETAALVAKVRMARAAKKVAEEQADEYEFQVCDYIRRQWGLDNVDEVTDDARLLLGSQVIATWKGQSRSSIDSARLRADKPEIATAYSKTSYFRVLRPKKA